MSEWQPIETAPKTGWFLGFEPAAKPGYQVDCYCAEAWRTPGMFAPWRLTHWMPLPAPPTPTPESENER